MFVINELLEDIYEAGSLVNRIAPKTDSAPVSSLEASTASSASPQIPASDALAASHGNEEPAASEENEEEIARKQQQLILENRTYLGEMKRDNELDSLKRLVIERVREIMAECVSYKDSYEQFSYLWTVSINVEAINSKCLTNYGICLVY
jgi:dynein heavy chain